MATAAREVERSAKMAPIANNAKRPETVYTAQARTGLYTVIYGLNFKGDITIHAGGATITQSKGITELSFSESAFSEYNEVENVLYFKTSDTEMTLIPYAALKDDVPDEPKKTNDGQTVFTIDIGSFMLKVNDLTIWLARHAFTENNVINVLTIESDDFNWILDLDREKHSDDITVNAMPCNEKNRLNKVKKGDTIKFQGSADIEYVVTKVEPGAFLIKVTALRYENGAPTGESYILYDRKYVWAVPSATTLRTGWYLP
jgi:hypothetical protein